MPGQWRNNLWPNSLPPCPTTMWPTITAWDGLLLVHLLLVVMATPEPLGRKAKKLDGWLAGWLAGWMETDQLARMQAAEQEFRGSFAASPLPRQPINASKLSSKFKRFLSHLLPTSFREAIQPICRSCKCLASNRLGPPDGHVSMPVLRKVEREDGKTALVVPKLHRPVGRG